MNLTDFKLQIKNKTFKSTDGTDYQFIPENTLRLKHFPTSIVQYEIKEENEKFILYHNNLVGNEPLIMEVLKNNNYRLELTITKLISGDFLGTWIEQQ